MAIDKSQLYATFEKSRQRRERLADLATRKALDLPVDDDMQINNHTSYQGLGRLGAVVLSLAMLAGGGGSALGIAGLLGLFDAPARPPRTAEPSDRAATSARPPAAQEFKVTFWAEDGWPIEVASPESAR